MRDTVTVALPEYDTEVEYDDVEGWIRLFVGKCRMEFEDENAVVTQHDEDELWTVVTRGRTYEAQVGSDDSDLTFHLVSTEIGDGVDTSCMRHDIVSSERNTSTNRVTIVCSCGYAINAEGRVAARQAHAEHAASRAHARDSRPRRPLARRGVPR